MQREEHSRSTKQINNSIIYPVTPIRFTFFIISYPISYHHITSQHIPSPSCLPPPFTLYLDHTRSRQTATRRTNPGDHIPPTSRLGIILNHTHIRDERLRELPTERLALLQPTLDARAAHRPQAVIRIARLGLARLPLRHLHEESAALLRVHEDEPGLEVGV